MTIDDNTPPNDNSDDSITPPNDQDESLVPNPPEETVSKKDHLRAMSDLKKIKQDLEDERAKSKETERKRLAEKEDYKSLYEQEKSEREEIEKKYRNYGSAVANDKKLTAVREQCIKLGIREEALSDLDILDLESVEIETTSHGNINVLGARAFAEDLKVTRPHWFGKKSARVNTDLPLESGGSGQVTFSQLEKLAEQARKSGDYSAYEKAHAKYRAQIK